MEMNDFKEVLQSLLTLQENCFKKLEAARERELSYTSDIWLKPTQSESVNDLYAAMAKAQAEMGSADLNSNNPYFKSKYADFAEIIKASRPALTKYGLSVIQQLISTNEGQLILVTRLGHSSGQWVESRVRIVPPKSDIQTIGSYITYFKRYTYAALIGVSTSAEDDDGEIAMERPRNELAKPELTNYKRRNEAYEVVTKEQLEELEYELQDLPQLYEEILLRLQLSSLSDMPKNKYSASIRRIREIKNSAGNQQ